jgi:hypothetical protein
MTHSRCSLPSLLSLKWKTEDFTMALNIQHIYDLCCNVLYLEHFLFIYIWLSVHHSITFFIITNLIHKFLVHLHKLHEIKFLYMFRAQSANHQEVNNANCTYAASGIVTLCKWLSCTTACLVQSLAVAQDNLLSRVTIPEAASVKFVSLTSWWWAECARNM